MAAQCKHLLSPIKMGGTTVKNRVVFSSHETLFRFLDDNDDGDKYIKYLEERAKGGCGFLIAGPIMVHPSTVYLDVKSPNLVSFGSKMKRLAESIHKHGAKVVIQLLHCGKEMDSSDSMVPLKAFSDIPSPSSEETPHEMTVDEIDEIIECFVNISRMAKESGIDGVELHATHGYLLQQSWSPWANQRKDEYGDPFHFVNELILRVREAVGNDFLVGIRISVDDWVPGGLDTTRMAEVAKYLESTGKIDFINTSAGSFFGHYAYTIGPNYVPPGVLVPLVAKVKASLKSVPIFATVRINDPLQAESILENGYADMVVMTRAQIADPEIVRKASEGRIDDIRHCIACVQGCVNRLFNHKAITCMQNPTVGREAEYASLRRIPGKSRLAVVGGGPAGLEAARVARERGFEVVLLEKEEELGGQVRLMCRSIPEREEFNEIVRWREKQIKSLGVEVRMGVEADLSVIKDVRADRVIIATGALSRKFDAPGCDSENVFTDIDWVNKGRAVGSKVLIVDKIGKPKGLVIADHFTRENKKVTIVTKFLFPGMSAGFTQMIFLYQGLLKKGTSFIPHSDLLNITGGEVNIVNLYSNTISNIGTFDTILTITPPKANDGLFRELVRNNVSCRVIGDAAAPRDCLMAIRDAFDTVTALEA